MFARGGDDGAEDPYNFDLEENAGENGMGGDGGRYSYGGVKEHKERKARKSKLGSGKAYGANSKLGWDPLSTSKSKALETSRSSKASDQIKESTRGNTPELGKIDGTLGFDTNSVHPVGTGTISAIDKAMSFLNKYKGGGSSSPPAKTSTPRSPFENPRFQGDEFDDGEVDISLSSEEGVNVANRHARGKRQSLKTEPGEQAIKLTNRLRTMRSSAQF
ncbi:unnamed protein product, partial [Discosporangium mesarthrocarpum]